MQSVIMPGCPKGQVVIPPSKSLAHRAILSACLAAGESVITNFAFSQDMKATIGAMEAMGATIQIDGDRLKIVGCNPFSSRGTTRIDCLESGSTLRFVLPLASLSGDRVCLTGAPRLLERPMDIYADLWADQGLYYSQTPQEIVVQGALKGGAYRVRGDVSSQFITGLLFTLPLLEKDSIIEIVPPFESRSYVQLTLDVLHTFGIKANWQSEYILEIPGRQQYEPAHFQVEGDWSQGAFFAAMNALGGQVELLGLCQNSAQGDWAILQAIEQLSQPDAVVDISDCPDLGPILTVLAAFSPGTTQITGAARLRIKESDRIAAMESELRKLGVTITSNHDTIFVEHSTIHWSGEALWGHNDHRIVMALSVASLQADRPVTIQGIEAINKSFPTFFEKLADLGILIQTMQ